MTYQEALTQEIRSLPPALLPEVLDFILFLKIKKHTAEDSILEEMQERYLQQELEALSQSYRTRLAEEGKLEQSAEEVMTTLKKTREEIAENEYRQ